MKKKKDEPKYLMESESEIKNFATHSDKELLDIARDAIIAGKDLGALPVLGFFGEDASFFTDEIVKIAGVLIKTGQIHAGMLRWSYVDGPNESFAESINTKAPQIFFTDVYRGEWLDRLKIFYYMSTMIGTIPVLESVSQLYTGNLSVKNLEKIAEKQDTQGILGKNPNREIIVKFLGGKTEQTFKTPTTGLEFLQWLGSYIPVFITIDRNSAKYLIKSEGQGQYLAPDERTIISRLGELCDNSIKNEPSIRAYSKISLPMLTEAEIKQIRELKINLFLSKEKAKELIDLQKFKELKGDEKKRLNELIKEFMDRSANDVYNEDTLVEMIKDTSLENYAIKLMKRDIATQRKALILQADLEAEEGKKRAKILKELKRVKKLLEFSTEGKIEGNSNLAIFTYDKSDVHNDIIRKEICEYIPVDLPARKFRQSLVFKTFYSIQKRLEIKNISLKIKDGIDSITPLTSGLNSVQTIQAVKKAIKNQVHDAKTQEKTDKNIDVELQLDAFESERRELLSNIRGFELITPRYGFEAIAGHEFNKKLIENLILKPMKDKNYRKAIPQGAIMYGPPGVGKTLIAEAVGYYGKQYANAEYGIVKLSAFKAGIVGESEGYVRKFKSVANSVAQDSLLILFIDEIDIAFGSGREGGGDSGVSSNIMEEFLTWFGSAEIMGRIFVLAATNRPDLIDPALQSRLPMGLYFEPLDSDGVSTIADIRFTNFIENIDSKVEFEGGKKAIGKYVNKLQPRLAGRELVFALNSLATYSWSERKTKNQKVKVTRDLVDRLIGTINATTRTESEDYKRMDALARSYATWKSDFDAPVEETSSVDEEESVADDSSEEDDDIDIDL